MHELPFILSKDQGGFFLLDAKVLSTRIENLLVVGAGNSSGLREPFKEFKCLPEYKLLDKSGLEHKPLFTVSVSIKNFQEVNGTGTNLKNAEEKAASKLLSILRKKLT